MKDFSLLDKALKLNWVKRLIFNSDAPWQYIPKLLLACVGGTELFKCNYDYNLLDLDNDLPAFNRQIVCYWQNITTTTPKNKNEVLSQTIWNNRFITVNGKMVHFLHWYRAGVNQISDLFYSCEGRFLPFNSFCNKFNLKCNFLQYYSILSSIPQNWKKLLQEAEAKIIEFCKHFEKLHGPEFCTPNMHLSCHHVDCIRDYGPLYSFWCFSFERYNGILGSYHKNNHNIGKLVQYLALFRGISISSCLA